ncbi:MAG: acyltransferase 3 [Spirosoma sp.]|nr:acyltransferase 3 [Spirosoma sp.]
MSEQRHVVVIDAWRGVAASVVVIHHLTTQFPIWTTQDIGALGALLNFIGSFNTHAVMLFFVISGYCIRASIDDRGLGTSFDLAAYSLKRAARILPPYWIALALTAALMSLVEGAGNMFGVPTLIGNLLFLQTAEVTRGNWVAPFGGNGPLWSISYEVFYYSLFPILMMASRRSGIGLCSLPVAALLSLLALALSLAIPNPFISFLALYVVWRAGASVRECAGRPGEARRALVVLLAYAAMLLLATRVYPSDTAVLQISGVIIAAIWLALEAFGPSQIWPPLAMRLLSPVAWLGGFSYGLYLVHFPIMAATRGLFQDSTTGACFSLIASLGVAVAVERIGLFVKNVVLRRLGKPLVQI